MVYKACREELVDPGDHVLGEVHLPPDELAPVVADGEGEQSPGFRVDGHLIHVALVEVELEHGDLLERQAARNVAIRQPVGRPSDP